MGLNTLSDRSNGQVSDATWWNVIHQALRGSFVGRNSSTNAPEAGHDLGTLLYPWGTLRCQQIIVDGSLVDFSSIPTSTHKVVSGKTRSTSNQPAFITPAGVGNGPAFTLAGAVTPLLIEVSGTQGEIDSDVAVSSLSTAPSSNNTCLVDDSDLADGHETRIVGERESGKRLFVDNMASEILSLIGQRAAFKIDNGSEVEYFTAYVRTSTDLRDVRRGFFYDENLDPINRIPISNNDTITLMALHWVFADTDGSTVDTTAVDPVVSATEPSSPSTGNYWFDLVNKVWKRYDGAAFQTVNRVLVGMVVVDDTDCVAARCIDFYADYKDTMSLNVERIFSNEVRGTSYGASVSVAGNLIEYGMGLPRWHMNDLVGSADLYDATEQASRMYYLYIKDTAQEAISDIHPYWRDDLRGWYHPHNPWRCVGRVYNDASSNFGADTAARVLRNGSIIGYQNPGIGDEVVSATASSTSYTTIGTLELRSDGSPVLIKGIPSRDGGTSHVICSAVLGGGQMSGTLRLQRDSTTIGIISIGGSVSLEGGEGASHNVPISSIEFYDWPPPGQYTYTLAATKGSLSSSVSFQNISLLALKVPVDAVLEGHS